MEGHGPEKATALVPPGLGVLSLLRRDASVLLRGSHLLAHEGVGAFVDAEQRRQLVGVEPLDVRGMRPEAVFRDDALEGGAWRSLTMNRLAAWRSQSFWVVPSCLMPGSGLRGSTTR
jgi:hypothetical protein